MSWVSLTDTDTQARDKKNSLAEFINFDNMGRVFGLSTRFLRFFAFRLFGTSEIVRVVLSVCSSVLHNIENEDIWYMFAIWDEMRT